jgi:hypothetical protein
VLQNQERFDFVESLMLHGWDAVEASRVATRSGPNFLPHHEPIIRSGSRANNLLCRGLRRAIGEGPIDLDAGHPFYLSTAGFVMKRPAA